MTLRSKTVRLGIFISTIIIGLIIVVQVFWLYKQYHYEEKEFDHHIFGVLKEAYAKLPLIKDSTLNLNDLISKTKPQVYYSKIEQWQAPADILSVIENAMEDFDVFTDCHVALYQSSTKKFFYEADIHPESNGRKLASLPATIKKPLTDSIILYFPNREKYILSNMLFWIISSFILFGVLIWLGASIFYLYRQKTFNELQKDFVNNFTHEFKTPLSVIMLAAESLRKKSVMENPERIANYADMVQQQSQYLHGQIDRLLRYSFSENSDLKLNKEVFDIHELIREAISNLQPLIEQKKAIVSLEALAEKSLLVGDKNYILIVLINLIENALKYSTEPKVIITTDSDLELLKISVKDNGVGIEEKYFGEIFKKFFRVPKGDIHSSKGFGIGLSFVKKIIDSHHGLIEVKSVPGIGSNFTISLHQNNHAHA